MFVNFGLFQLFWAMILLVAFGFQTNSAVAEAKYPSFLVDLLIDNCMAQKASDTHAVYASSPIGVGFCSFGAADLKSHREVALKRCTRQIPNRLRPSIECGIVVEDGKVVDRSLLSSNRKEFSAPAEIIIFDGETGNTETRRGFVTSGRYNSFTHQVMRISLDDGKLLCEGFRVELSSGLEFRGKCFGKFEFSGALLQPTDVFLYKGDYVDKISFRLKKGKSYIKVTTGQ